MLDFLYFIRYNEVTKNKRENETKKTVAGTTRKAGTDHQKSNDLSKRYYEREVQSKENLTAFDFSINRRRKHDISNHESRN